MIGQFSLLHGKISKQIRQKWIMQTVLHPKTHLPYEEFDAVGLRIGIVYKMFLFVLLTSDAEGMCPPW